MLIGFLMLFTPANVVGAERSALTGDVMVLHLNEYINLCRKDYANETSAYKYYF